MKVVCAFGALGGIVGVYDAIASFRFGSDPVVTLVLALVQLAVVVGLWEGESWGWILGMALYGASVPLGFVDLWHVELWAWILGIAFYGLQNPLAIEQLGWIEVVVSLAIVGYLASKYRLYR